MLEKAPLDPPEIEVNRFLGAEVTAGGVRFVQPDSGAQVVSVAGDFNAWAPIRLKRSEQTGMLEITVPLPEGRYRYQILVDGQAGLDSYNDQRQNDPAIGPCNVLIVG
jgi:1,4-alpha-glucan branching enzyme